MMGYIFCDLGTHEYFAKQVPPWHFVCALLRPHVLFFFNIQGQEGRVEDEQTLVNVPKDDRRFGASLGRLKEIRDKRAETRRGLYCSRSVRGGAYATGANPCLIFSDPRMASLTWRPTAR